MTREQVLSLFPDATDEQVTSLLNNYQGELAKVKGKAEQHKVDAARISELEAQLESINQANMSEVEKANALLEKANQRVSDLEAQIRDAELKKSFAEQGIVGENADKLVASIKSGQFDTALLGQIIAEKTSAAVSAKEAELMASAPNPSGTVASQSEPKTEAEKAISNIIKNGGDANKHADDVIANFYL